MNFTTLIELIFDFSKKAAVIAKSIRDDENLFSLLIEEKTGSQKNKRFAEDFKTLADVLIQQTLAHEIDANVNALSGRVFGEECASFNNSLGESITVSIQESQEKTSELLAKVLNGNIKAADILAYNVHRKIQSEEKLKKSITNVPLENLGIWIDPIDSTAEYIKGIDFPFKGKNLEKSEPVAGLCCVTVLVGIFDISTGLPVAGVINQPFSSIIHPISHSNYEYKEDIFYGIVGDNINNMDDHYHQTLEGGSSKTLNKVCLSASENAEIFRKFEAAGIEAIPASGAGFKALIVATGHVQAYVCTKGSTYMWDMCAPHALLLSMGGGIIPASKLKYFEDINSQPDHKMHQLKYISADKSDMAAYCNYEGVIAYKNTDHLHILAKTLL